ncbi:HD domain-containing protein [Bradyrhizobium iriomotense]|uniref:HD domain-containing protein n=1 Tax=Bradyrhizobium iriomotense TaxID=441950 RepID=UPI001B8A7693|nr:ATP-binding protein [Bradyrhizobium iriomotense]MBR1129856.1 ATP-binding protein [Bradyrhizobium iriomotense]
MSYTYSYLWNAAFGDAAANIHKEQRDILCNAYLSSRRRVEQLVQNISADLRHLTIHDITHLDALWGVASEIVGPEYPITPTEAFVLGASFLLHDAGMCLAAYPGGLAELKRHKLWQGTLRKFARNPESPCDAEVDAAVKALLRIEHANRAMELPHVEWSTVAGARYYLLEDADIRQKFGNVIGEISASHWWDHNKVAARLDRILPAPPPFPVEWRVDLLKIASLLRVSDAAHVDERRAPGFVWALRRHSLDDTSNLHWLFQNRLTQPERRADALYFGSTSEFLPSEAESWWLAHDVLRMINEELRSTDVLLADLRGGSLRFSARRVANVESATTLVNSIRVRDWIPIDTSIKISDVPDLIRNLGGRSLYGDSRKVPLRELLQNAADAIRLKSEVLSAFTLKDGRIRVRLGKDGAGFFLEVADNGIGMSQEIIAGPFLDFGNSGWSTDPAFVDYPNADPQKLNMIGKFGIGFFSVFMLGDKVEVRTRRFDRSFQDTIVLSFGGGVGHRPILRPASQSEWMTEGGTSVKVWFKGETEVAGDLLDKRKLSLRHLCELQFPLSEVAIHVNEFSELQVIQPIDWKIVEPEVLLKRLGVLSEIPSYLEPYLKNIRPIYGPDQKVAGRIFLAPSSYSFRLTGGAFDCNGVVASRGVFVSLIHGIYGVVEGNIVAADRSRAEPTPTREEFGRWLIEQADLLSDMALSGEEQVACSEIICVLGGDTRRLGICSLDADILSKQQLAEFLSGVDRVSVVSTYELRNLAKMNPNAVRSKHVLGADGSYSTVFESRDGEGFDRVLRGHGYPGVADLVIGIVGDCWALDASLVRALRAGRFDDRQLVSEVVIARTERGEEILGHGVDIWKGMTIRDLRYR